MPALGVEELGGTRRSEPSRGKVTGQFLLLCEHWLNVGGEIKLTAIDSGSLENFLLAGGNDPK